MNRYERHGLLADEEIELLNALAGDVGQFRRDGASLEAMALTGIGRLVRPLTDASAALCWSPDNRHQQRFARDAAGLVLIRCGILGRAFWEWSTQDWTDLISVKGTEFRRSWPGQIGPNARPFVIAYAYLLGDFTAFGHIGRFYRPTLARRVFGNELVDDAVGRVCGVLTGWGYRREKRRLTSVICHMLLINRSPLLDDLSTDALIRMRADPALALKQARFGADGAVRRWKRTDDL